MYWLFILFFQGNVGDLRVIVLKKGVVEQLFYDYKFSNDGSNIIEFCKIFVSILFFLDIFCQFVSFYFKQGKLLNFEIEKENLVFFNLVKFVLC